MAAVSWRGTALMLELQVQPGASRDEIVGAHGDRLKVRITAPPIDGRANQHLIHWLADVFGVPRTRIALVRGATGRAKTVCIESPARLPPQIDAPRARP